MKGNEKAYIGTKVILAEPMSQKTFTTTVKDIGIPDDREGYKVIYEDGYVSWSPKEVFERCYREVTKQEIQMIWPS